ncbi:ABC transporter substrate-binding protein [Paenibacillus sp. GCM10023248]|uniref:ABC transporter substrate-binding protein n=1 Tax=Bacillales TaxID=1385 RepID=UPI002378B4E0|nr:MULTISPECIES: ABC transporter substrate-binding protein [Bacillales]MDD9268201.1 ABC transporter substrate-binding protein [Paenibacillus sp. MAHUQ-63]MDR6879880.1 ABC-type glycerol-3-phosphate transport system substrate-binding protein [Bacillus sp. 3255]
MITKRSLMATACVSLLASIALTACGNGTEQLNAKKENAAGGGKTLTFWRAGTDAAEKAYWTRVIQEFEASHQGVKVNYSEVPFGNDMETKLNAAYASGTAPDVLSYSLASVAQRANLGQYEPLDAYLDKWAGKSDLMDSVYQTGTYKGKLYGIGFIPDPRVLLWRKDLFEAAGLNPEKPPANWEELSQYAQQLTKKEGDTTVMAGLAIPTANSWTFWQSFVLQNGAKIIDVEKNEPLFDSPEAIEATQYIVDLVKKGVTIPNDSTKANENLFPNGKAAIAYDSPAAFVNTQKDHPELTGKIGVAGPIERKQKATFAGMRLLFMGSQSKQKDLAFDFMQTVMSKEETWKRYKELGTPVVLNSLKTDYIKDKPEINQAVFDAVSYGQGAAKVTYSSKMYEIISQNLEAAFYGKKTGEQAMKEAADALKKELPNLIAK